MRRREGVGGADVNVMREPGNFVSFRLRWQVVLWGGLVCDHLFLLYSGQGQGTCVRYAPAIACGGTKVKPRWWWASGRFKDVHAYEYRSLRVLSTSQRSVWREAATKQEFAAQVSKNLRGPRNQHRPLQAIGLVTEPEKLACFPKDVNMFTPSGLLDKFQNLDVSASATGACGF